MAAKKSGKLSDRGSKRLLYDARGARVKQSPLANRYVRALLFVILPYIVLNGIIFLIVCSAPKITIEVGDTNDYVSAGFEVTVKSLLPLKSIELTQESSELDYEKSGSSFQGTVTKNGTIMARASALNGMTTLAFADVSILDDTAPNVDESSAAISDGKLSFTIYDTQSGVDFDSISGIVNDSEEIYPESVDKDLGLVVMSLPADAEVIDLSFSDLVGNMRTGRITVTIEGVDTEQEDDSDRYLTDDIEDSMEEYSGEQ